MCKLMNKKRKLVFRQKLKNVVEVIWRQRREGMWFLTYGEGDLLVKIPSSLKTWLCFSFCF